MKRTEQSGGMLKPRTRGNDDLFKEGGEKGTTREGVRKGKKGKDRPLPLIRRFDAWYKKQGYRGGGRSGLKKDQGEEG